MRIAIGMNRWMPWALGAFMAVATAGCAGSSPSVDDDDVDEATAAIESDAGGPADHGRRGHDRAMGGPGALFHLALGLDLTDAQRAKIEEAQKTLELAHDDHARPDPKPLADAIRAGKVDPTALEAAHAAPSKDELAAHHAKVVAAIQTLHDTLTADQRTALVASAKEKLAKGPGREGREGGPDGREGRHGRPEGRGGPPEGRDGPPEGRGGPDGMKGRHGSPMDFMLHGLEISDAQRTKIDEALKQANLSGPPADAPSREDMEKRMTEMKARGDAMLDAFAKDAFDAKASVPTPPEGARPPGPPQGRFLETLAVIVPLLEPAQRDQLADRILEGPPEHGRR